MFQKSSRRESKSLNNILLKGVDMKKNIFILILILSSLSFTQNYEMALYRIEQAFITASPSDLWPLISYPITIRIEDSLYQDISDIQAEKILKEFFQNKDSIEFDRQNRVITYVEDKKRKSLNVDVFLKNFRGEVLISAINISNYPSSTAFFNFSK